MVNLPIFVLYKHGTSQPINFQPTLCNYIKDINYATFSLNISRDATQEYFKESCLNVRGYIKN